MKRLFAMLLVMIMLLSLSACGADNPNAGVYNAISCTALGLDMDCDGDWLELKGNGKGTLCLMGEEYACKWTLEEEDFTLENHGDVFYGTLHNGVIRLDLEGMAYVYRMDPVTAKDGTLRGHVHQWQEANCLSAKTCPDCDETEGTALGHDATEANYQDASVCSRCSEVLEEPLVPDMVLWGYPEFMEVGKGYEYHTRCNYSTARTVGLLTVTRYEIFDQAEGYPARDGYEWRVVEMEVLFTDQNAKRYGISTQTSFEDYYTIRLHDDTVVGNEDGSVTYQILYHGQTMDVTYIYDGHWVGWHYNPETKINENSRIVSWAFCVPKGYDGVVVGFRDAAVEWPENGYISDMDPYVFLLFRLA